jgi:translation initiation factor IF-1
MPKNDDLLEVEGEIAEILPNQTFKVILDVNKNVIVCYTGGRMRQNKIRLVAGDRVRVELSSYDLTKGRITFRI